MELQDQGQAHDHDHDHVLARDGRSPLPDIPHQASAPKNVDSSSLQCCCGRLDCAYLKHNNVALEDLEKDLETAARLGQVRFSLFRSLFGLFYVAILLRIKAMSAAQNVANLFSPGFAATARNLCFRRRIRPRAHGS